MKIIMNTKLIKTLEQVRDFLEYFLEDEPGWESKRECYQWVEGTLSYFRYRSLGKADKGLIRRYLATATGYFRAQVTRLLHAYSSKGAARYKPCTSSGFQCRYTKTDIHGKIMKPLGLQGLQPGT